MFWIIKFNYKRLIRYWYWIVIEIGYIWFMILSLIISEDVVNNTLFLPFNFINLSNFCLLWIFSLFLFLDYKSGMWNYIISSKIKKNNIVISYLFSGIILAILNTLFFLLLV